MADGLRLGIGVAVVAFALLFLAQVLRTLHWIFQWVLVLAIPLVLGYVVYEVWSGWTGGGTV